MSLFFRYSRFSRFSRFSRSRMPSSRCKRRDSSRIWNTRPRSARGSSAPFRARTISTRVRKSGSSIAASRRRTSRSASNAASSTASKPYPILEPRSTMCANRGCNPIAAIRRPCAVMRPSLSSAPSAVSSSRACANAPAGGRSSQCNVASSAIPAAANSSANEAKSASNISGVRRANNCACSASIQSL